MRRSNRKTGLACGHPRKRLVAANGIGQVFVVKRGEPRLVVPQVHLRGSARHEEVDAALGRGWKVRQMKRFTARQSGTRSAGRSGENFIAQEDRQSRPP